MKPGTTLFCLFKQKTAYEIMPSLVGSEMCIRDRLHIIERGARNPGGRGGGDPVSPGQEPGCLRGETCARKENNTVGRVLPRPPGYHREGCYGGARKPPRRRDNCTS